MGDILSFLCNTVLSVSTNYISILYWGFFVLFLILAIFKLIRGN